MTFFHNWIKKLNTRRRKHDPFVQDLLVQARWGVRCGQYLVAYLDTPSREKVATIKRIEKAADTAHKKMVQRLNRTFVTPIDREDLYSLSRSLDDVIDHTYSLSREMYMLNVQPDRYIKQMARLLLKEIYQLYRAIQYLEHKPAEADKYTIQVSKLENQMSKLYSRALVDLLREDRTYSTDEIIELLKRREIYRHMYESSRRAEKSANRISDIIMEFY